MALIKCPKCNHEISDTIKKCIHCGEKLKKEKTINQDNLLQVPNSKHNNKTRIFRKKQIDLKLDKVKNKKEPIKTIGIENAFIKAFRSLKQNKVFTYLIFTIGCIVIISPIVMISTSTINHNFAKEDIKKSDVLKTELKEMDKIEIDNEDNIIISENKTDNNYNNIQNNTKDDNYSDNQNSFKNNNSNNYTNNEPTDPSTFSTIAYFCPSGYEFSTHNPNNTYDCKKRIGKAVVEYGCNRTEEELIDGQCVWIHKGAGTSNEKGECPNGLELNDGYCDKVYISSPYVKYICSSDNPSIFIDNDNVAYCEDNITNLEYTCPNGYYLDGINCIKNGINKIN